MKTLHYRLYFAFLLIFFLALATRVFAQEPSDETVVRCGVGKIVPHLNKVKPQNRILTIDDTSIYEISVVFHVIHSGEAVGTGTNIPESRIKTQIRILNEDYRRKKNTRGYNTHPQGADANITFKLAEKDPSGTPSTGIVRVQGNKTLWNLSDQYELKNLSRWPSNKYLNIWICNLDTYLGYSSFPVSSTLDGLPFNSDSLTDGVIINYKYVGESPLSSKYNYGRTATHEVGHYLGLVHIWGQNTEDCSDTDYCNDTPTSKGPNYDCKNAYNTCPDLAGNDMTENYLNYSNDACMNTFTNEQVGRMRTVLQSSPRRQLIRTVLPPEKPAAIPAVLSIYPNPCTQDLLTISNITEKTNLLIVNSLGQKIMEKTVEPNIAKKAELKLSPSMQSGHYFVKINGKTFPLLLINP